MTLGYVSAFSETLALAVVTCLMVPESRRIFSMVLHFIYYVYIYIIYMHIYMYRDSDLCSGTSQLIDVCGRYVPVARLYQEEFLL